MSIEADLLLGKNPDRPDVVFLVSHSTSEKNSNQKFWRNIGELGEAKTRLPKEPVVVCIVFDDAFKPDLLKIQEAVFDSHLRVTQRPYWRHLQSWLKANAGSLPSERDGKITQIEGILASGSPSSKLLQSLRALRSDLLSAASGKATWTKSLWSIHARYTPNTRAVARHTFVRRGIGKALLFPSLLSENNWKHRRLSEDDGHLGQLLNMAQKTMRTWKVSDPEVEWATTNIPFEQAKAVVGRQPLARMDVWIRPLRDLHTLGSLAAWLVENWPTATNARLLFKELRRQTAAGELPWLYHLILDVLKALGGTQQSYGLATLLDDIKRLRVDEGHIREVERICRDVGTASVQWRDDRGISLGLGDWANGPSQQRFPLFDDDLARVCDAFARRLSDYSTTDVKEALLRLADVVVATNLEAKLLPYRLFDPVRALIELSLIKSGLPFVSVPNEPACFASALRADGVKLDPRSGGTAVIRSAHTLINWQSAHESHTNDKRKELCGRAFALRYEWDVAAGRFMMRPGVQRLVLVLDGTWKASDFEPLSHSGWDEILLADELHKLPSLIV